MTPMHGRRRKEYVIIQRGGDLPTLKDLSIAVIISVAGINKLSRWFIFIATQPHLFISLIN